MVTRARHAFPWSRSVRVLSHTYTQSLLSSVSVLILLEFQGEQQLQL